MSAVTEQVVVPYHQASRFTLYAGNCRSVLPYISDCSVDSIVSDPPYELGFMGKGWDRSGIAYDVSVWSECLRVLKPGGHLLAFGGSRTYHRLACAIEDAGFEIRDQIQWLYGCLSDDTEILINGRWEPYHKAVKGSLALCYNVDHDTFEWQPVQEMFVYQYSDTAYRIESDLTDQIVSRNHRCLVEQRGAYTFRVAEEVARERAARVPILENVSAVLNDLSVLDQRASRSKQDMRASLRGGEHEKAAPAFTQTASALSLVQEGFSAFERDSFSGREDMRVRLPRSVEAFPSSVAGASEDYCEPGSRRVDRRIAGVLQGEDERRQQSSVEGRRNLLSETWELQADQVCAMPAGVLSNGPQRWLRDGASFVSGPGNRAVLTSPGSGPSRRSRPDQQSIDELPTIRIEPRSQTVRASRFTRSDLARITPFHYDGVVWCVRVPSGAFVARRNGKVFITGNSGFPKSLDVSKAIDHYKRRDYVLVAVELGFIGPQRSIDDWTRENHSPGDKWWTEFKKALTPEQWGQVERRVIGTKKAVPGVAFSSVGPSSLPVTVSATAEAVQWEGWGTALKPAHEPIVLARKPLIGTVAENVLQHGTGGLNVEGCRIGESSTPRNDPRNGNLTNAHMEMRPWMRRRIEAGQPLKADFDGQQGRWPANVIHDGSDEVLAGFPETASAGEYRDPACAKEGGNGIFAGGRVSNAYANELGSAARFFYCAKASQEDRNEGLEGIPPQYVRRDDGQPNGMNTNVCRPDGSERKPVPPRQNFHPTVKPTELMRYLCRLITPPGGLVLDPFCGSGSTGKAAMLEGLRFVGIELNADYCELAQRRIEAVTKQGLLFA